MDQNFLSLAADLAHRREAFATATIVRAVRPTSAKPGDKAIVTSEGELFGWIGGSCAAPTVIEEALASLADGESRLIHLSPAPPEPADRDGLIHRPMTCFSGGGLEIYIEPCLPMEQLIVFGRSPIAHAVASLGRASGFEVLRVDLSADAEPDTIHSIADLPTGEAAADARVVVATHGNYDEEGLEWALGAGTRYIGLVTSRRRFGPIRKVLEDKGADSASLDRVRAPAGLDIGAKKPEEVAVSILAEIIQGGEAPRSTEPVAAEHDHEVAVEGGHCCHDD